jgi:hypothetical protein
MHGRRLTEFKGRRRKVKCLPLPDNPTKCKACLRRGSKCVEQELAPARAGSVHRKKLSERIGRLEHMIQTMKEEKRGRSSRSVALGDRSTVPLRDRNRNRSINSTSAGERSPSLIDDEESISPEPRHLPQYSMGQSWNPQPDEMSVLDLLVPSGIFKHQKICRLLVKILESTPNVAESLNDHSHLWANNIAMANPNASIDDLDINHYARRAIASENPIQLARVVQIALSGAPNIEHFQKMVTVIDRLVVYDEEYLNSLEGLECCFEQGRFYVEMGQVKGSW